MNGYRAVGDIDGEPVYDGGAFGFIGASDSACERCGNAVKVLRVYESDDKDKTHDFCTDCILQLSQRIHWFDGM